MPAAVSLGESVTSRLCSIASACRLQFTLLFFAGCLVQISFRSPDRTANASQLVAHDSAKTVIEVTGGKLWNQLL